MTPTDPRVRTFTTGQGDEALRFADGIRILPGLTEEHAAPMSAYTASFAAGARAPLPAPYVEVWVLLTGALRVGAGRAAVTVEAGEYVYVAEQAPGAVEALEDTTMVCISVPAH